MAKRSINFQDLEILERLAICEARESFGAYRQYMHPKMKSNWFTKTLNKHLELFYDDLIKGLRPKLAIQAPPQHGKSTAIVDFITWIAGKHPELRTIYASFSERLGVRANLSCQRILSSDKYKLAFPDTTISSKGNANSFGATRNRELIEFIGHEGFFRNTTVRGSITGESLDLGIVDDPIKGREAANSEVTRDSTWEWMTDDFMTRFSEDAGLLMIMTRWHVDDPLSRLQKALDTELKVVRFPAIAEGDERYRKEGEPLFPELKSLNFLMTIKKTMASSSWVSLFQQDPQIQGGEIIRGHWFKYYKILPQIVERHIYADTAQKTKEANDYSVFLCAGRGSDGNLYLIDIMREKLEAPQLRAKARMFWNKHNAIQNMGGLRSFKVEDKSSGTGLIQEIRAPNSGDSIIPIMPIERTIDKYTRVLDGVGYIESGFVYLPEDAPWVHDFVAECEAFTANDSHLYDDQVDTLMDAIKDQLANKSATNIMEMLGKF